jgi:hypothetical protein
MVYFINTRIGFGPQRRASSASKKIAVHVETLSNNYGENRIGIDTGAFASGRLKALYLGPDGIEEI